MSVKHGNRDLWNKVWVYCIKMVILRISHRRVIGGKHWILDSGYIPERIPEMPRFLYPTSMPIICLQILLSEPLEKIRSIADYFNFSFYSTIRQQICTCSGQVRKDSCCNF